LTENEKVIFIII